MKGIGLVFSGGGGKGAYQIGVWKYLHQYGLDQFVRAVSGTSVGALNAALFASGDVQRAEDLWLNIEPEQILTPRKITWNEIAAWVGGTALLNGPIGVTGKLASTAATATASAFASGFLAMLGRRYAFSRDGLMELIQQGVDFSIIQNSPIPCYATCLSVGPTPGVRRFDLRRYNSEDSQKLLLASSAIPIIFDAVEFEGSHYYDGGVPMVGDNIPIQPVYETGVEYILVVHLSQDSPVDRICYPNARLLEVIPQRDLGGPIDGTLDFTASGAKWRMEQGWKDMEKILSPFVEQAVLWKKNELLLQAFLRSEQEYQVQVQELQRQKEAIQQERETDGLEEIAHELGLKK